MNHLLILAAAVSTAFLLIACGGSSTKRLARGSYQSAIAKAVKNLQKDPTDLAELDILKKAYAEALLESNGVIDRLKMQNNGEALMGVVSEYQKLDRISDQINSLPTGLSSQFDLQDYTVEIQEYTAEASNMMFAEAEDLMQSPVKADQRLACEKFRKIKQVNPQFPEIERWIEEAELLAITKIWVNIDDDSKYKLKDSLTHYIQEEKLKELNRGEWQKYSLFDQGRNDGEVRINIHKIGIEKNTTVSQTHNFQKEIDEPEYVLDGNGNVKKDADGNDMKVMKKRGVKAQVIEESIDYDLVLRGSISYIDHYSNSEIKSEEIDEKSTITQSNFQISGDKEAIDQSLLVKIEKSRSVSTPDEKSLVAVQIPKWKEMLYRKIRDSKKMFP